MTLEELKEVERHLDAAEKVFLESRVYSLESQKIWHSLRELLVQVTVQRFRLERPRGDGTSNPFNKAMQDRLEQLVTALATYQTLITDCVHERDRLIERRKSKPDGVMVVIDELLEANGRTLANLNRAIEMTTRQIQAEQQSGS